MNITKQFTVPALYLALGIITGCDSPEQEQTQPNIVYILADDLGYNELGSYGQEIIETPHLDTLAKHGMRFTQHYSGSPVCAPSRFMLMSGKHPGHAYIRGNDEWLERGDVWDYEKVINNPGLEGQRPIPDTTLTVAEVLQKAGYTTAGVGKWGLGAPRSEGVPHKQGFDLFYGYNCQRMAHTFYPPHLWCNSEKDKLNNPVVPPHQELPEDADPYDSASYNKFSQPDYAPAVMLEETMNFMDTAKSKPFFLYFASPLPHLPLQAPARWVEYYHEKLGEEEPYTGNNGYFPSRYPRATYAAMISYLDEQVGEIIGKLKAMGEYENTLIIFTSDNGPTYTGGADTQFFDSAAPFNSAYGWSKGFVHEGGIRVPMIASWPGKIKPGSQSNHISAFWDVMPTLAEVAGAQPPQNIDGISFLPTLTGQGKQKEHEFLYWEFPSYHGQQAVRMGKWKGIRDSIMHGQTDVDLYNLEVDIREENNVADQYPEILKEIKTIMQEEHTTPELEKFRMKALDSE
jgi:arylsulfatase